MRIGPTVLDKVRAGVQFLTVAGLLILGVATDGTAQAAGPAKAGSPATATAAAPSPLGTVPGPAAGDGPPPKISLSADVTGFASYGNTSERRLGTLLSVARGDRVWEMDATAIGTYSDVETPTTPYTVNRRSGSLLLAVDHRPFDDWSPFAWAKAEGSLEYRIALRSQVALGLKRVLYRTPAADSLLSESVALSLAIIREETRATASALANPDFSVWRWSARLRTRRKVTRGMELLADLYYRPLVAEVSRYTLEASGTATFPLATTVGLVVRWRHLYDSEATLRGARSNSDGTINVGLRLEFARR